MADETPPLDEARLAFDDMLHQLNFDIDYLAIAYSPDPGIVTRVEKAMQAVKAEVDRLRAEHNEAWDLIDRLAEDLADHAPIAHDWLIDEANVWREKHPKTKQP